MSAEVTWRLSDKGKQCIFDVASDVSVGTKCVIGYCKRELGEAIRALAGQKIDFYHCDGKPVALVTLQLTEEHGCLTGKISISTQDCPKGAESYVRSVYHLLCGVAEYHEISIDEPRRNCDVGTLEEQVKRMDAYCASHGNWIGSSWRCDNCPLCSIERCELAWAHMPYEDDKGKVVR